MAAGIRQKNRVLRRGFFDSEKELQLALSNIELNLVGHSSYTYVRREVPIRGCIPDLIYVRFSSKPDPTLWPAKWTFRHTYLLWLLRQKAQLTLDEVASHFFELPTGPVRSTMEDLIRSGAVTQTSANVFALSDSLMSIEAEVIAIEAKLFHWKQALAQAKNYAHFADKVFVAMDYYLVPQKLEVLEMFSTLGIGLCAVLPEKIKWIVYPRKNCKLESDREYLITSAACYSRQTLWSRR